MDHSQTELIACTLEDVPKMNWRCTITTTTSSSSSKTSTTTTGKASYSEALIIITAIEIFLFVLVVALCFGLAQRRSHQRKLELSEDYAREEAERRMRKRIRKSERKRRKKSKQASTKPSRRSPRTIRSRGKEEVERAFRNFLEAQAETYTRPEELMQTQSETALAPVKTLAIGSSEVDVALASYSEYSRNEKHPSVSTNKANVLTESTSTTQLGIKDVDVTLKTSEESVKRKNIRAPIKFKPTVKRISPKRQSKKGATEVDPTFPSYSEKSNKPKQKPLAAKHAEKLELQTAESEGSEGNSSSETYQKKCSWKRLQKTPRSD
ncbi:hypothetical protein Y032_0087g2005 [Ancylostoma ceylanicum]|uniref:Uncharacterized protein n=1 Tax=Ancylostoma ceylanicum TaxID=53326 RepID=A0A016TNW0_9BILA|nr:hypothetical protein Y032_0087g2005 [Ancylostoma ceylanicum]